METLYARLTELCKQKGVSGFRFCKDLGLQPSLMTDLKAGRQKNVSANKAAKIAEYFGVSPEYILYGETKEPVTTTGDGRNEKLDRAMKLLESLPEIEQDMIVAQLEGLSQRQLNQGVQ